MILIHPDSFLYPPAVDNQPVHSCISLKTSLIYQNNNFRDSASYRLMFFPSVDYNEGCVKLRSFSSASRSEQAL